MTYGRCWKSKSDARARRDSLGSRCAFTLVELLVVIGIIAVLVSVLLPALGKAKQRALTISCQSNLRQIYIAARSYAAENKDSLPFGMIFNKQVTTGNTAGRPADAGSSGYITWFGSLDRYMTKGAVDAVPLNGNSLYYDGSTKRIFSPAFRCPSVEANFNQKVHYYNHGVAMPHMPMELNKSLPVASRVRAPARFSQLYPDNALFWDTPLWIDAGADAPSLFWVGGGSGQTVAGYTLACPEIDDAQLSTPQHPERRYRGSASDRFAQSTNPMKRPDGPISWPTDEYLAGLGYGPLPANADTSGSFGIWNFAFGGPRWRHNANQYTNVSFADGSVRSLHLSKRIIDVAGVPYYDNEFRRYMLMMKWPNDKKDSGNYATN
ncbi:hypothetical protein BH09PLA1_BH09PLA1_17690 [soil metagenome]